MPNPQSEPVDEPDETELEQDEYPEREPEVPPGFYGSARDYQDIHDAGRGHLLREF
jgi:hypothetical protein